MDLRDNESHVVITTTAEEPQVFFTKDNIELFLGDDSKGHGTLTITDKKVVWQENKSTTVVDEHHMPVTHTWGYPDIPMHAISSDTGNFPKACIYCHLESTENADGEEEVLEMRLAPPNPEDLQAMFAALNKGAELNPDPLGDSDEGEFFFNPAEIFGTEGFQVVDNVESVISAYNNRNSSSSNSEQFMDVDDKEDEGGNNEEDN